MGSFEKPSPTVEATTSDGEQEQDRYPSPTSSKYEVQDDANSLDLKVRPVHGANTGTWKAAKFLSGLALADWQASIGLAVTLVTFLLMNYGQPVAVASAITTDVIGASFLLTVLGGFIADSYLGAFYTVVLGGVVSTVGLAMLTFVAASPSLRPPPCKTLPLIPCSPAAMKYMAPLYIAVYTVALGTGLIRVSLASLGGEQFDESVPAEKKQILSFFIWFYFLVNIGIVIAFTLGVYLHTYVSHGWGYGFSLMFYIICFLILLVGTPRIRRKQPSGSFLTRMAQVFVASIKKSRSSSVLDKNDLYNTAPIGNGAAKTIRTNKLRFLDRAAMIDEEDKKALEGGSYRPDPWRLCSVAQVEESKNLLLLVPIWASTTVVTLIFSQLTTFTIQQALSMDRKLWGADIPPASVGTLVFLTTFLIVPIYKYIVVPIAKRFTGSPYGLTPIIRMGISLIFAILTMIVAGLVERKRVTYVRAGHFELYPLGSYQLPMSFWWLLPSLMLAAFVEFFFYTSAYEFFFFETSEETRTIGSSFTFSSAAMGYFMSSVSVDLINSVTSHQKGGSWVKEPGPSTSGQFNTGGLENFYYFLAGVISVGLTCYVISAYFYECKHDWYGLGSLAALKETTVAENSQQSEPLPISSSQKETPGTEGSLE